MKQQLLGGEKQPAQPEASIPGTQNEVVIPGTDTPATETPAEESESSSDQSIEIKPRPEAIENIAKAKPEVLRAAIQKRDTHIDHLMAVITQLKKQAGTDVLEQMKTRQAELEEQLRKTEVEMAQERARLSRKEAELQKLAKNLESQPVSEDPTDAHPKEEKSSRWSRFLGSG